MVDYPPPPYDENGNHDPIPGEEVIPGQYQEDGEGFRTSPEHLDFNNPDVPTDEVEIENPVSPVASAPAKNILIFVLLVIAAGVFLYQFVFKEDEKVAAEKELQKQISAEPVSAAKPATPQEEKPQVDIGVVETPTLPEIENLQPLPPPTALEEPKLDIKDDFAGFQPPPTAPAEPAKEPAPKEVKIEEPVVAPLEAAPGMQPVAPVNIGPTEAEIYARQMAKRKAGMIVINGGGSPADVVAGKDDKNKLGKTSSAQVTATQIGDLNLMIAQGKMIDAVLETTINTDLPGTLRAVISRDVYAESGKNILIPRGSRLIGEYQNKIQKGQRRVLVSWGRVIRPDGVDISIASPGTDQLGRAGVTGIVDNKYFEIFSNSILVSALTVGGAILVDKVQGSQTTSNTTTTNTDGSSSTTQSGNPTDLAVLEAVQDLSDTATGIAENLSGTQPTIIVNQGARVKVFVNKDLIFPQASVGKAMLVN